ncbi:MAG: DUF1934 domain-containing protein [Clostridia bacterium]
MKQVYVEINGHVTTDGETDTMSYSTEGKLYKKSGKLYINYTEGELLGREKCSTTLKVAPDGVVTMLRSGEANTRMVFEKGQCHISCYETPYGNLTVSVTANDVAVNMNESGGHLDIDYNLSINNTTNSRNHLVVKVRS